MYIYIINEKNEKNKSLKFTNEKIKNEKAKTKKNYYSQLM